MYLVMAHIVQSHYSTEEVTSDNEDQSTGDYPTMIVNDIDIDIDV